jgi:hypothetical protein
MSGAWLVLFIGLWVVCIALMALVLGLSRRIQSLEWTVFADRAGSAHAETTGQLREQLLGTHVAEHAVESGVVGAAGGMAGVVLFVSEHCGPCQTLASDLSAKLERNGSGEGLAQLLDARVTVITDQAGAFDELGATAVLADADGAVMNGFAVSATPTGLALDDEGVVIEALIANKFRDVEKLAQAVHQPDRLDVTVSP